MLNFLIGFLFLYFVLGFIYALYILFFGKDPWYVFPINVIGGPVTVVYLLYMTLIGRKVSA